MAVRKKTHRKLRLESLERRTLLDGTVFAALDAKTGVLAITGDARDNGVEVTTEEIGGAWHVKVAGAQSTWIATRANPRGTKVNTVEWVSFPAANVKGIAIDMKDGRNSVRVDVEAGPEGGNLVLAKDFSFRSGKHLDCLFACGFDVQGNINIRTGAGGDTVELGAAIEVEEAFQFVPVNVAGTAAIDLGPGNNFLQMRGTVGKDLAITTATGIDAVFLAAGVGGNLAINMGANQDTLWVAQFAEIPGPPTAARVGGNATVNMGDGNNSVQFNAQVDKNLTITGGKHLDSFLVGLGVEPTGADPARLALQQEEPLPGISIQGNLNLDSGAGNDTIYALADVGGRSAVKTGAGIDYVFLTGTLQGNVALDTGADADWVLFYATAVASVDIKTGAGADGVWVVGPAVGGNLAIDAGADGDDVTVLANVGGNVSLKTGDGDDAVTIGQIEDGGEEGETPAAALDGEDPPAPTVIQGSLVIDTGAESDQVSVLADVHGGVSLKTGDGDDVVTIGWRDPPLTVRGSLLIEMGAGDDSVSMANVVVAASARGQQAKAAPLASGDVRIALGDGGELFENPNGQSDVPYLTTENVRIWGLQAAGRLTVDGGNGDNSIALLQCNAAHADVVNGPGSSLIAIGQLGLGGTGNLSIKNGPGDHGIFIGARFGWNEFFPLEGAVEFGVAAASVAIQTASVNSGQVTVEDSNIDRSLAIDVTGGDVRIALSNVQGLPMPGGYRRVAQVSIRTSAGNDQLNILPRQEGDFGLKADRVSLDTGVGNDSVAINALEADQALASLGAGDDLLACGDLTTIASAVLDGGAGARDRYEGPTPANWQIKNFEEMPAP